MMLKTLATTLQENRMKRTTLILLGATLLIGSGCANPDPAILVTAHVPLEGSEGDEPGTVADCTRPEEIGSGIISQDVFINLAEIEAAGVPFTLGLLMQNRLINSAQYAPIGEDQNQRLDQNHIEIQGYEVNLGSDFSGLGSSGDLRYEATGILPTDGTLWAGVALFYPNELADWRAAFNARSANQSNAIVPAFAEVQVVGETIGGTKVESNMLTIPIQICDGCARTTTAICVISD